jgi:hypothetical protein
MCFRALVEVQSCFCNSNSHSASFNVVGVFWRRSTLDNIDHKQGVFNSVCFLLVIPLTFSRFLQVTISSVVLSTQSTFAAFLKRGQQPRAQYMAGSGVRPDHGREELQKPATHPSAEDLVANRPDPAIPVLPHTCQENPYA